MINGKQVSNKLFIGLLGCGGQFGPFLRHIGLGQLSGATHGADLTLQTESLGNATLESRIRHEREAGGGLRRAKTAKHRTIVAGLGRGQRGIRIAHIRPID